MSKMNDVLNDSMVSEIDILLQKVKKESDSNGIEDLKVYKKIFKRTIPRSMRPWISAYLLRQSVKSRSPRTLADAASLFISVGRNRKVYPKNLIHLFIHTGKIEREEIGEIKIFDNYSFIEIKAPVARKVIDNLDGINFRGRTLNVNFAKKSPEAEASPPD